MALGHFLEAWCDAFDVPQFLEALQGPLHLNRDGIQPNHVMRAMQLAVITRTFGRPFCYRW